MRNKFPGTCYKCGKPVAAFEGHFERFQGRWRTQHAACCLASKVPTAFLQKALKRAEFHTRALNLQKKVDLQTRLNTLLNPGGQNE